MHVAVLGASGLIGSALVEELRNSAHQPIIFTRNQKHLSEWHRNFTVREWDTMKEKNASDIFEG